MRLLLDECVPRPLQRELAGHQVSTVVDETWSGKRNSELLGLMVAHGFQSFLTVDQDLQFQQNVAASGHGSEGRAGNPWLKWLPIEFVQSLTLAPGPVGQQYQKLLLAKGRAKATVAADCRAAPQGLRRDAQRAKITEDFSYNLVGGSSP